jgi:hypothetical protein
MAVIDHAVERRHFALRAAAPGAHQGGLSESLRGTGQAYRTIPAFKCVPTVKRDRNCFCAITFRFSEEHWHLAHTAGKHFQKGASCQQAS